MAAKLTVRLQRYTLALMAANAVSAVYQLTSHLGSRMIFNVRFGRIILRKWTSTVLKLFEHCRRWAQFLPTYRTGTTFWWEDFAVVHRPDKLYMLHLLCLKTSCAILSHQGQHWRIARLLAEGAISSNFSYQPEEIFVCKVVREHLLNLANKLNPLHGCQYTVRPLSNVFILQYFVFKATPMRCAEARKNV